MSTSAVLLTWTAPRAHSPKTSRGRRSPRPNASPTSFATKSASVASRSPVSRTTSCKGSPPLASSSTYKTNKAFRQRACAWGGGKGHGLMWYTIHPSNLKKNETFTTTTNQHSSSFLDRPRGTWSTWRLRRSARPSRQAPSTAAKSSAAKSSSSRCTYHVTAHQGGRGVIVRNHVLEVDSNLCRPDT